MARGVVEPAVRIGVERVQPEVAPARVLVPVGGESHHSPSPVGRDVAPQGRDLEGLVVGDGGDRAVLYAGRGDADAGGVKGSGGLVGGQGGGDVNVIDGPADHRVADAAADEAGAAAAACRLQGLNHCPGGRSRHPRLDRQTVAHGTSGLAKLGTRPGPGPLPEPTMGSGDLRCKHEWLTPARGAWSQTAARAAPVAAWR